MLISIIAFLIIFTFLALAHEAGHLIWAKRAGIRVFEFGIGFGPRLYAFDWHNTTYSINLFPILAFVRIAGEGESEEDLACPANERFHSKTPLQKFKALAAGPGMNVFVAFVLLVLIISLSGVPSGVSSEIGMVTSGSPAQKAGLKVGDRLLGINGTSYKKMEDAIEFIHKSKDKQLTLLVERGGQKLQIKAIPKYNPRLKAALLGFAPKPVYRRVNPLAAVYYGAEQAASMILVTLVIVGRLITGGVSLSDLAGPVGIAQVTGKYAESGLVSLAYFAAFLNVNVGVLNLLPLPALDGGGIIFVLIEWIRRKPLDPKLINKINAWGLTALLVLMALVTLNDIARLFGRP